MSRAILRLHRIQSATRSSYPPWRNYNDTPGIHNRKPHDGRCLSSTPSRHQTQTPHHSSVSPSEISHFQSLASTWWDPHGPSRLLHLMNPLRHEFIQSCLQRDPSASPSLSYLDIGCGGGIFASSAARLPSTSSVTAIDPTPEVIAVAKDHQRRDPLLSQPGKLKYINCAIEDLQSHLSTSTESQSQSQSQPSPPSDTYTNTTINASAQTPPPPTTTTTTAPPQPTKFDIITLFEVLEHIPRPSPFLSHALTTHLKPGGWLIGSTIARHPLSYFTTKIIGEAPWPVGMVPPGTHDWTQYINAGEIRDWVGRQNKAAREVLGEGGEGGDLYGDVRISGVIYVPFLGWKWVQGSEEFGNYFFGLQKLR